VQCPSPGGGGGWCWQKAAEAPTRRQASCGGSGGRFRYLRDLEQCQVLTDWENERRRKCGNWRFW